MNKISLIIAREYLSRVRKKSFIVLTILVPLLFIGMNAGIAALALGGGRQRSVLVLDESEAFIGRLKDSENMKFSYLAMSLKEAKDFIRESPEVYLLHIPVFEGDTPQGIQLFAKKQVGVKFSAELATDLGGVLQKKKLLAAGVPQAVLDEEPAKLTVDTQKLTERGEETGSSGAAYGIALVSAMLIYMFVFMYGVQVMRGVIEEKVNRIVEVLISSVRPFELMMGKIIGIALVGLTQFLIWVFLIGLIGVLAAKSFGSGGGSAGEGNEALVVMQALETVNVPLLLGCFLFYFLAGYLLYGAVFAAIGSAVDNETETQQFMMPVTIPLVFAFIFSMNYVVNNPDTPLSFWMSVIPFFSPVVMMARLPYGVDTWEILLSMALLILSFLGMVWFAAKIYRTGILMYGKKASWKEMLRWMFYKS